MILGDNLFLVMTSIFVLVSVIKKLAAHTPKPENAISRNMFDLYGRRDGGRQRGLRLRGTAREFRRVGDGVGRGGTAGRRPGMTRAELPPIQACVRLDGVCGCCAGPRGGGGESCCDWARRWGRGPPGPAGPGRGGLRAQTATRPGRPARRAGAGTVVGRGGAVC